MARAASALLLMALLLPGCAFFSGEGVDAPPATDAPAPFVGLEPRALFDTSKGRIVVQLALEEVPGVVQNFLDLAASGAYDGTRFHRVAHGSIVQGGDPNTRSNDTARWGYGGPGRAIPDELHPALRHDAAGILSMASAGPDTAGSQFFFTLAPAPGFDDRNSVFGRVVAGQDVLDAIGAAPNVGNVTDGRPLDAVVLRHVSIQQPASRPAPTHRLALSAVLAQRATNGTRPVDASIVVRNLGDVRENVHLEAEAPEGWTVAFPTPDARVLVPAGTARLVLVRLTPPEGATDARVRILGASNGTAAPAAVSLGIAFAPLGEAPRVGENATVEYAGLLPDGRLFDTNIASVAADPNLPHMEGTYVARDPAEPLTFTVGSGVIPGFSTLAARTRAGETTAARIAWQDGFPAGAGILYHRDVVYEMRLARPPSG